MILLGDVGLDELVERIASLGECLLRFFNGSLSDLEVCVGMVFSVDHYIADALFEFSEIARPAVAFGEVVLYVCEGFLGQFVDFIGSRSFSGNESNEVFDFIRISGEDTLKGGCFDFVRAKSIVEILSEVSLFDRFDEIYIGGGHDFAFEVYRLGVAEALEFLRLKYA